MTTSLPPVACEGSEGSSKQEEGSEARVQHSRFEVIELRFYRRRRSVPCRIGIREGESDEGIERACQRGPPVLSTAGADAAFLSNSATTRASEKLEVGSVYSFNLHAKRNRYMTGIQWNFHR